MEGRVLHFIYKIPWIFFVLYFEGTFGCKIQKESKLEIIDIIDLRSMFCVELKL